MPRPPDDEWIGQLYDRYGVALHRYAVMVLADPAAAADAVQTVFVGLLRRREPHSRRPRVVCEMHAKIWTVPLLVQLMALTRPKRARTGRQRDRIRPTSPESPPNRGGRPPSCG